MKIMLWLKMTSKLIIIIIIIGLADLVIIIIIVIIRLVDLERLCKFCGMHVYSYFYILVPTWRQTFVDK